MTRLFPPAALLALAVAGAARGAEQPVAPYQMSNANAGARAVDGGALFEAFHGRAGIERVVNSLVDRAVVDPRIADIFRAHDLERLRRTLGEQFCYLLNGPCAYSGRDMASAHKDLGIQNADFNALVEDLQMAMDKEGVPYRAQNKLLARLAPLQPAVVTR